MGGDAFPFRGVLWAFPPGQSDGWLMPILWAGIFSSWNCAATIWAMTASQSGRGSIKPTIGNICMRESHRLKNPSVFLGIALPLLLGGALFALLCYWPFLACGCRLCLKARNNLTPLPTIRARTQELTPHAWYFGKAKTLASNESFDVSEVMQKPSIVFTGRPVGAKAERTGISTLERLESVAEISATCEDRYRYPRFDPIVCEEGTAVKGVVEHDSPEATMDPDSSSGDAPLENAVLFSEGSHMNAFLFSEGSQLTSATSATSVTSATLAPPQEGEMSRLREWAIGHGEGPLQTAMLLSEGSSQLTTSEEGEAPRLEEERADGVAVPASPPEVPVTRPRHSSSALAAPVSPPKRKPTRAPAHRGGPEDHGGRRRIKFVPAPPQFHPPGARVQTTPPPPPPPPMRKRRPQTTSGAQSLLPPSPQGGAAEPRTASPSPSPQPSSSLRSVPPPRPPSPPRTAPTTSPAPPRLVQSRQGRQGARRAIPWRRASASAPISRVPVQHKAPRRSSLQYIAVQDEEKSITTSASPFCFFCHAEVDFMDKCCGACGAPLLTCDRLGRKISTE